MNVGIIHPIRIDMPKLQWVHDALLSLGIPVMRGTSAADFPSLSQECDLVILFQKGLSGRWPDLKAHFPLRKAIVVQWWNDLIAYGGPLSDQTFIRSHGDLMRACDIVFVKEAGLLDEYKSLGINAHYLDQGCAVDVRECVRSEVPRWDVLVWGTAGRTYRQRMRDAADLVQAGFSVAWASQGEAPPRGVQQLPWCHPDKLPELAGQASCVLCVDKRHDLAGYASDRLWMALGMGCAVIRRETPGLPEGPYVRYAARGDLLDKTRELLARREGHAVTPGWPPAVLKLGKEARSWCLANHTLAHRCRELLRVVSAHTATALAGSR